MPPASSFSARGRARYVVTDRDGVRSVPSRAVADDIGVDPLGRSVGAYRRFDLARHVGDDPLLVEGNRADLAAALGLPATSHVFMDQVHGAHVEVMDSVPMPGAAPPQADALVTTRAGLALAVLVADCVPVVLADEDAGVIGVAHAGRRGVQLDVVGAVVSRMVAAGADPAAIAAVVGPAICGSCYEVPAEMRDEVVAIAPTAAATSATGTAALDLRRAVLAQLDACGVTGVQTVGGCTREDSTLYSFRRDGTTGRFAMLAWLPVDAP